MFKKVNSVKHFETEGVYLYRSAHPNIKSWFFHFTVGWGSFQLGYSGSADSEPGRCRRTDGKKWRCSRDAVVDQKYCERHINRGRHRSRKHVEGQSSHAAKATVPAIAQPPIGASNGKLSGSHGVSNELTKTLATNRWCYLILHGLIIMSYLVMR